MLDIKLVAYAPFGERLGELPQPLSIESADPLSDTPSMTVKYSKHAAGHALLQQPIEIAREVYNPSSGQWFEPVNGRFLLIRHEGNQLDATGNQNYICPGYSWLLNKLVVYPVSKQLVDGQISSATGTEAGKRATLVAAEDNLANSWGVSRTRPVVYSENAPDNGALWVKMSGTTVVSIAIYNETNYSWTHTTSATVKAQAVNAYNAYVAHQESQGQLRDVQGRAKLTKRVFQGLHAGAVMAELINEARSRGQRMAGMEFTFSTTHDSAGQPWGTTGGNVEVNVGTSLLRLMQTFVSAGQLDFRTEGRKLHVYKQDTAMLVDRSSTVVMRYGLDIDEAPDKATLEHVASEMLFLGEDGLSFSRSNPTAPTPWGTWEASVTQSGVDNEAMGILLANRALQDSSEERVERTRSLIFRPGQSAPLPYVHYQPGDKVLAPNSAGELEAQRVEQITLTKDKDGQVQGNLVLHDRFLEREIRNERRTQALIGGTGGPGGTGGATSPETYIDLRTPEAPRFLVGNADTSPRKGGGYESFLGLEWWWSRKATDGTALTDNLSFFEVQFRMHHFGQSSTPDKNTYVWRSWPQVDPSMWEAVHGPVDTVNPVTLLPAQYEVRVRAQGRNGKLSAWSPSIVIDVPLDATPPPAPSRAQAVGSSATLGAVWDGKNATGGGPPLDFAYVVLEEAFVPDDAPATPSDSYLNSLTWTRLPNRLGHAGTTSIFERAYDQGYAYRFVMVDQNENESPAGAPSGVVTPKAEVDEGAISDAVEEANQANKDAMATLEQKLAAADTALASTIRGELSSTASTLDTKIGTTASGLDTKIGNTATTIRGEIGTATQTWDGKLGTATQTWDGKLTTTANTLRTEPVVLGRLVTGEVALGSAVANEFWARKIVSSKVQANEVVIGTGDNLIANGYGELGDDTNFSSFTGYSDSASQAIGAKRAWRSTSNNVVYLDRAFQVTPFQPYRVYLRAKGGAAVSEFKTFVTWYNTNGAEISTSQASYSTFGTGWSIITTGQATAPAGAVTAKLGVQGNFLAATAGSTWAIAQVEVQQQKGSSLIVKGGITTDHLAALSIEAGHIKANAITGDKLDVESARAKLFTGDAFVGRIFKGGYFEGANFVSGPTDKAYVAMNDQGIFSFNDNKQLMFWLDSSTGKANMVGQIRTGWGSEPAIIMSSANSSWNKNDQAIWFTNSGVAPGFPSAPGDPTEVAGIWAISDSTVRYPLNIRGYGAGVRIWNNLQLTSRETSDAQVWSNQDLTIDGKLRMEIWAGSNFQLVAGNNVTMFCGRDNGIYLRSSGFTRYNKNSTTGGNVMMANDGCLVVNFSTRALKADIQPADKDERIFDIEAKTFLSKPDMEELAELEALPQPITEDQHRRRLALQDGLRRQYGAIAEEVEATGVTELVNHADDGSPASLRLELLGLKLLPFVDLLWQDYKERHLEA